VCHGLRFAAFGRLPNVTALEGMSASPRNVADPRKFEPAATGWKWRLTLMRMNWATRLRVSRMRTHI
jgi:hypothetical protein